MFAQFFGHYLLNQGIITSSQLQEAMASQKDTRVKLGVLAINQEYMTASQVEQVHQTQMTMDKRFGEIAVELGFLTEEQVEHLLSSQKSAHLLLGQALIDQNVLTYDSFSEALSRFKKENSLSDEQFASIMNGDIDTLISSVLLKEEKEKWMTDYISLFAKNLIRFVDTEIRIEMGNMVEAHSYDWFVSQEIATEHNAISRKVAIGGDQPSFLRLASRYADESIKEADDMMQASVGEFLNLHNGIFLVNMSNNLHVELELKPQMVSNQRSESNTGYHTLLHVIGSDFSIDLLISDLSALVPEHL